MSDIHLTPEQLKELYKCQESPVYFAKNYTWIMQFETSEILPFNPLPYRIRILKILWQGLNLLGNKSRRAGWSYTVCVFIVWLINFHPGINVLMLSYREEEAKELLDKVKFILKNLARHDSDNFDDATKTPWLMSHIEVDNQTSLSIGWHDDNGNVTRTSTVSSLPTTGKTGAGRGATLIFLDEFGLMKPNDEQVWTAIKPTVARGGQWIGCSTPRGVGGVFHRLCMQAQRKENKSYQYMETHWSETEITPDQYEAAIEGVGEDEVAQEWEMSFSQSGDPVFNGTHLAACYKPVDEYPELKKYIKEYHQTVHTYFSGVDSAQGKAHKKSRLKDYNCFTALSADGVQVFCESNKHPLAQWAGYTTQGENRDEETEVMGEVSQYHAQFPGTLYIEENGPGLTVINRHKLPNDTISQMFPIPMHQKQKAKIIQNLILAVQGHQVIITDLFTYQCMSVYQKGDQLGQYSAPIGYNDDPVMALALAWDALLREKNFVFDFGLPANLRAQARTPEEIDEINAKNAGWGPMLWEEGVHPNRVPVDLIEGPGKEKVDTEWLMLPDVNLMRDLDPYTDPEETFYDDMFKTRL